MCGYAGGRATTIGRGRIRGGNCFSIFIAVSASVLPNYLCRSLNCSESRVPWTSLSIPWRVVHFGGRGAWPGHCVQRRRANGVYWPGSPSAELSCGDYPFSSGFLVWSRRYRVRTFAEMNGPRFQWNATSCHCDLKIGRVPLRSVSDYWSVERCLWCFVVA